MKTAIATLIHEMEGKLGGYVTLLVYRYANLCVKAQPLALMPVVVEDEEEGPMNIEQVAGVTRFNFPLSKAIKLEHPEFKQDLVKPDNADSEDERHLILTMPEVNSDRHDELTDAVGVLYDGCKAQVDKTVASYKVKLEPKIVPLPQEQRDEAQAAFDECVKMHKDLIDKQKEEKLKEIDEAYQRYLDGQSAKKAAADEKAAAHGEEAGKQFRIDNNE